jgi:hypothetical protein
LVPFLLRHSPLLAAALAGALAAPSASAETAPRPSAAAVVQGLREAWNARDEAAYLALFRLDTEGEEAREREFVASRWRGEEALLEIQAPYPDPRRAGRASAYAQVFSVSEPRARVAELVFRLESGPGGWAVAEREQVGDIEGLVHLSLAPQGYQAAGVKVRLEDFEMTWTRGSLFTSPASVGPTVLVFVGEGVVRFHPRPETEREQLRQVEGRPELVEKVRSAFVRIHPADFHRVLTPSTLTPDPQAAGRLAAAERVYREEADQTFVLDTTLPRSPWWLVPGLGDALVTFHGGRGTLTYVLSRAEAEGITVFDRKRRRQYALYPVAGRDTTYDEDAQRGVDVLHHELTVRMEPDGAYVGGENRMRVRLLGNSPTMRLRLDESLRVESVRSAEGGEHIFFRVRHQDALMVSLGALAGRAREATFVVRFSGRHAPAPVEREVLQDPTIITPDDEINIEPVHVYSNRTAWYPQGGADDHATAVVNIDVPDDVTAITGGAPVSAETGNGRTRFQYRQDVPGKYITIAVGRLFEAPGHTDRLRAWAAPRVRAQAVKAREDAAEMMAFYEGLFGPSPYPSLNLVVIESRVPGGHAPPGMVVLSLRPALMRRALRDDPASFWDVPGFFLAHEIAHQWWGHGVAARNYHERWISEAMAHYAAALWVRHSLGEGTFRNVMARMARWALRHADKGPLQLGHRLGHLADDAQIYRAVVYDKGAWVLHMLREQLGDEAFREALVAFQAKHRYGKAGASDLRRALEEASGRDLAAFFAQWVDGTAIPELSVSRRTAATGDGFETEVSIRSKDLEAPMPVEVAVLHEGGREVSRVEVPPGGGTWTIRTARRPRRVELNRDGAVLARVTDGT